MSKPEKLTLCVFIDAFGWESVRRHPFLDDILSVKAPLDTIFGYSSTCDPTIITGKMPREHRHFAFFRYDPDHSPFKFYRVFSYLPRWLMERGRVRAKFSQIMKRVHGFTGYFQLYNVPFKTAHLFTYTEQTDIFQPGGINGGQPTLFDYLRENNIPYCRPESFSEPTSIAEAEAAIERGEPAFVFLFLGRLDALQHEHGSASPAVSEHIIWYENEIRRLYEKATNQYGEVRLMLFSDHGMTDIQETCDLMGRIDALGLQFGEDYAAVYDSTMARFWFLKPGAREAIEAALAEESRGRMLREDELAAYGCDFPDQTYGELFFLMEPGVLICPSHMGVKPLAGMHGFAPEDKDSVASFMANFRPEPMPARLDDLYTVMRHEVDTTSHTT